MNQFKLNLNFMKHLFNLLSTVFLSFLLVINSVNAQQDTSKVDLYDMDLSALMEMTVTTASKKAQNIDEAPAAVTVITKEDLLFYGVNNLGEALRLVPGMELIQGGDANYEVSVRGFSRTGYNTSNKVLWLVDGRSVYYDGLGGFRMESCPISIEDIEKIEVIRGSGSALYGANAFSGIVNIITKHATEDGVHGSVIAKYGNLNQLNTSANVIGKKNKLSYNATIGYNNIDLSKGRFEGLDSTAIDSLESYGHVKGSNTLSTMTYGNLALQYNFKDNKFIRVTGGLSNSKSTYYYVLPGEVKASDYFAQLDYKDEKNSFRAFYNSNPTFAYYQNKFMTTTTPTDPYMIAMKRPLIKVQEAPEVNTSTMDYEYQRNINVNDKLSAIAGVSYRGNDMKSMAFATDGSIHKEHQDLFAAFTQIDYKPIKGLNISLGGRYDNHTTVGSNFNPKIATVYKANDKNIIRAGWGTATRNPHVFDNYLDIYYQGKNFYDIGIPFDPIYNLGYSTPNVIFNVNGNTDLKPEKISSFELGYIYKVSDKLQLKLDAFYNITSNAIEFNAPIVKDAFVGSVSTLENIHAINPAFGTDLSGLAPYNGGVDPSVPDAMTKTEMTDQITELTNLGNGLIAAGQTETGQQLLAMAAGLNQVSAIYNYNLPRIYDLPVMNSPETYKSYGAEIGFTYIPLKGLTVTGNYSLLKFSENFNEFNFVHAVGGVTTGITSLNRTIVKDRASVHKANFGLKYKFKKLYFGTTFSYLSDIYQAADNNRNGVYDTEDIDKYDNQGFFKIDARLNLNVNIGFQTKYVDIFATGYNLIQSDYQQFYYTNTITGADLLNTRIMGGVKIKF